SRIGCREILNPAEERRVAHVDRDEQHLIKREEDGDLQQDRPASGQRIDLLLFVEIEDLFLLALGVVLVKFLYALHLRLQLFHARHARVLLVGKRKERRFHEHCQYKNRDAEVVHDAVDEFHQLKQRPGDEVEPAPVDHLVKLQNVKGALIAVDQRRLLGAGIEMRIDAFAGARRNNEGAEQI